MPPKSKTKKRNKNLRPEYPTLDLSSPVSLGQSEWPRNLQCQTSPVEVQTVHYSEGNKWIEHEFQLGVLPLRERLSKSDSSKSRARRNSGPLKNTSRNRQCPEVAKLTRKPLDVTYKSLKGPKNPPLNEVHDETKNEVKCSNWATNAEETGAVAADKTLVTEHMRQSTYPVPPDIITPSGEQREDVNSSACKQNDRETTSCSSFPDENRRLEILMDIENEMPKSEETMEKLETLRLFRYYRELCSDKLSRTAPDDELVPDTPEKDQGVTFRMKQLKNII